MAGATARPPWVLDAFSRVFHSVSQAGFAGLRRMHLGAILRRELPMPMIEPKRDQTEDPLLFAEAISLRLAGMEAHRLGRLETALDHFVKACELFHRSQAPVQVGWTLQNQGLVLEQLGRIDDCLQRFDEAEALFIAHGDGPGHALMSRRRGDVERRRTRYDEALRRYDAGLAEYRAMHDVNGIINSLSARACVLLLRARAADALGDLQQALEQLRSYLRKPGEQDFLLHWRLYRAYQALGQAPEAERHRHVAQTLSQDVRLRDDRSNPDVVEACAEIAR
jgi:tetratricopeptide (TPR) repeat protein